MEYVYGAMLLHAAGKEITEGELTKVLKAPGIKVDEARVKALVSALEDVDIGEVIKQGIVAPAAAAPAAAAEAPAAEAPTKEEKKEEEEEKTEEEAMEGLGALFG
ncbi:MAG: 50S ribosomal protein P1 [Candidatus Hydrothermarchaeaceae archaeon]